MTINGREYALGDTICEGDIPEHAIPKLLAANRIQPLVEFAEG